MAFRITTSIRNSFAYGISLAVLLLLLDWLRWKFLILDHATEIYIGAIALMFTALGVWLAIKLITPKKETIIIEKEVYITTETHQQYDNPSNINTPSTNFELNGKALEKSGISARELEVLQLMARGLSNQEIAEQMFVSLNTIKTHTSNIFLKLDVKRRTQAVDQARKMGLIP
jgi:ATP/maltotriose-dependent transcriptional regulator MalT